MTLQFLNSQFCQVLVTNQDFPTPVCKVIKRLWPADTNYSVSVFSALRAISTKKSAAREYPGVARNFVRSPDHFDRKMHFYLISASRVELSETLECREFCFVLLLRTIYKALGSPSVTLDSRQTVRFPPVEGRVVSM